MAKHEADLTTIDLFGDDKRPGRPKTNPHSRSVQVKINKRNQVKRDRHNGLKRVEFKIHENLIDKLDQLAKDADCNRSELIESLIVKALTSNENKS